MITGPRAVAVAAFERLEPRLVLAAGGLEISEFLAKNDTGLKDQFGKREDWIEIHNNSPATIDLAGYALTDDAGELNKWRFPSLSLQADQYLVVFASGNDLRNVAQPLHTNFKLSDAGDYLALVAPDGHTVIQDFGNQFPAQVADVSYGIFVTTQATPLTTASATPRYHVPTPGDATLGLGWAAYDYNDSAWPTGPLPMGYDADPAPPPGPAGFNVRVIDTTGTFADVSKATALLNGNTSGYTVVSDLTTTSPVFDYMSGGRFSTNLPLPNGATAALATGDPLREGYVMRATAFVTIPAGTYTVGVNSDDGFQLTIPGVTFTNRVGENNAGATSAANQITYAAPRGNADTLGTFTVGADGLSTTVTLDFFESGGGDGVDFFLASGQRTSFSAANFALVGNGAFGWGVYQTPPTPHFGATVKTNLQSQMYNVRPGAYLRIPFNLDNAADFDALTMRVKYDDGFVAYLNGNRIASRNAPAAAAWDSAATAAHDDAQALLYEDLTIPGVGQYFRTGVNVLSIHALNQSASDPDFLISAELTGVRTLASDPRFFSSPTPGTPNSAAIAGKVEDTKFSKDRGFYDQAFPVTITTATAGAQIRYTLDGSSPTASTGLVYGGPITISTTTTLRAAAFKAGFLSSDVDTQTYLFLNDVIHQSANVPNGYPATWNGFPADYGMDNKVVDSPTYAGRMVDALKSIPTLSLVLNKDDMFSAATGLYQNLGGTGVTWERPTSVELIYPDGRDDLQVNAGLRVQGGAGRSQSNVTKHSFRLVFSTRTGPTKLDFPWFDGSRVTEFDTITLRAGFNNSWNFTSTSEQARATYSEDEWMRQTQRAMGQVGGYGNFVHLYINGMYWGLYNPTERPAAPFAAEWYGGDKEDYDALNSSEAIDGTKAAWDTLQGLANGPGGAAAPTANWLASDANYQAVRQYLDVDNLIDYMLLNFFGGNQDWDDHNWYAARKRVDGAGYKFFSWDGERTLEDVNANRIGVNQADKPSRLYAQLRANPDFRLLFADHVQKHFFNGGALTAAANQARYAAIMGSIDKAILGESARWGDSRRATPYTRDVEWVAERDRVMNSYFPARTTNVLSQLKSAALFPTVNAPTFNQWGGAMAGGFALTMTESGNPAGTTGTIYYTLDGTDPRTQVSGAVAPGAIAYAGPVNLGAGKRVMARFLSGTGVWSALDDTTFYPVTPPPLRVTEIMYNPAQPPVGSVYAKDDFEYVEVLNTGPAPLDVGGMRFTDGITFTFPAGTILAAGQRGVIVRNPTAFATRYPGVTPIGTYTDQLDNGGERLRLETALGQAIENFKYADGWYSTTDGAGYSLVAVDPSASDAVLSTEDGWRASTPANGAPALADPGVNHNAVILNELLPVPVAGSPDGEWVELRNTTGAPVDVGGWFLSDSASNPTKYRIAAGTVIPAGGYLLLTQGQNFGNAADPGATTPFNLDDAGEGVYLTGGDGAGGPSGYRDAVDYGATEPGVTVGRYVKSTGKSDFVALTAPTPAAANAGPRVGPVVINEISYNPAGFGVEFVELFNTTGAAVALYDVARPANTWKFTDAIGFDFPQGATIPAGGYAIVTAVDPATFRATYNVPASVPVWGPFAGNLDNAGESLELSRPGAPDALGVVPYYRADKVTYDGAAPWPAAANGAGPTLSRSVSGNYGNDAGNWQTFGTGGTPGLVNSAIAPVVSAGASVALQAPAGAAALARAASFADASPAGETWTAVVSWGDAPPGTTEPLALNPDKSFALNHTYARPGVYTVVVRVSDSTGAFGTATFQVTVADTTAPTVTQNVIDYAHAPHAVTFRFSEDVSAGLSVAQSFSLLNRTTGQLVPAANLQLGWDAATNAARLTVTGLPGNVLADGDYRLTALAAGVRDGAGNALAGDVAFDFFVMNGDANRDRAVDFNDLVPLAQHYNVTGGMTWADGDFTGDGAVDFNDLVVLAQRYNTSLGSPAAGASAAAPLSFADAVAAAFAPAANTTPTPAPKPVPLIKAAPKPVKPAPTVKPPPPASPARVASPVTVAPPPFGQIRIKSAKKPDPLW